MKFKEIYYRRNLPHFQPPGNWFFITFRLHGSFPKEFFFKLKAMEKIELKKISGYDNREVMFEKYAQYKLNPKNSLGMNFLPKAAYKFFYKKIL